MDAELAAAVKGHKGWSEAPNGGAVYSRAKGSATRVLVVGLPGKEPRWHVAVIRDARAVRTLRCYGPGSAVATAELLGQ